MQRRDFFYSLAVFPGAASAQTTDITDDIRRKMDVLAPPDKARKLGARNEPHMTEVAIDTDLLVAGGGVAGVCAAVAAARHGARVTLLQ